MSRYCCRRRRRRRAQLKFVTFEKNHYDSRVLCVMGICATSTWIRDWCWSFRIRNEWVRRTLTLLFFFLPIRRSFDWPRSTIRMHACRHTSTNRYLGRYVIIFRNNSTQFLAKNKTNKAFYENTIILVKDLNFQLSLICRLWKREETDLLSCYETSSWNQITV